jgi:hypothetical protein
MISRVPNSFGIYLVNAFPPGPTVTGSSEFYLGKLFGETSPMTLESLRQIR